MANANHALVVDSECGSPASAMREQARRLTAMADELHSLADCMEDHADLQREAVDLKDDIRLLSAAREAYRDRRLRTKVFEDTSLFGEPAWDILLDLFIASLEGKRVPVTSACIGAAVPTTTALRWIALLEAQGLISRENDSSDARRIFVNLSGPARQSMTDYFARLAKVRKPDGSLMPKAAMNGGDVRPFMLQNGDA